MTNEPAILVVVFPLFRVAQNFPGSHDGVEFVRAVVAVGVFVRVILDDEAFILIF